MSYQLLETPSAPRRGPRLATLARSRPTLVVLTLLLLAVVSLGHNKGAEAVSLRIQALKDWRAGGSLRDEEYKRPSREEVARMVGKAPKYLVKDGWAAYGYNNQRYMLESTLILARIAGRIPIIPDAIWARACAGDSQTCRENALLYLEDRNNHPELLKCKWNDDGEVWKIGIEHFLDLPHLRQTYGPFLTFSEFFDLYQLPSSIFDETQVWNASTYLLEGFSSATLSESLFQNRTFVRVDESLPAPPTLDEGEREDKLSPSLVEKALGSKPAWTMEKAREALKKAGGRVDSISDEALVQRLEMLGAVPLHTFSDEVLMNKAISRPVVEIALRSKVQSLTTTLSAPSFADADIVYLQGNLHDQRKPGGVYFTTADGRDEFIEMVLKGIRAPSRVRKVGALLSERMSAKVDGRRWVAAHLRRGDFVNIAWSPSKDPVVHFNKTKTLLDEGVTELEKLYTDRLPQPDDPFYLATDETNYTSLSYYRSRGAVLLSDLLLPSDLTVLGPTSSYSDVLAVVEQQVLAHSDYFVGSELSSTSGGAVNGRLALGKPDWSWTLLKKG
ncbi:hypothetical protein JCM8547_009140 [Rhodosporidiobolus lusitaniae]